MKIGRFCFNRFKSFGTTGKDKSIWLFWVKAGADIVCFFQDKIYASKFRVTCNLVSNFLYYLGTVSVGHFKIWKRDPLYKSISFVRMQRNCIWIKMPLFKFFLSISMISSLGNKTSNYMELRKKNCNELGNWDENFPACSTKLVKIKCISTGTSSPDR